jgi:threonine aldolase
MDNIKDLRKTFLQSARLRQKELTNELSQCDLALSDAMHFLENENCDAVAMVKTAKRIKELRMKRRKIKVEWEQANILYQSVKDKDIVRCEQKTAYTYRTKVMDDIRHKN